MREIKFRGKRKDNKKWIYGYYAYFNKTARHYIIIHTSEVSSNPYEMFEVDPKTVGQYMGLKDENDKKIYEGDILQFNKIKGKVVVKYGEYNLGCIKKHGWYLDGYRDYIINTENMLNTEVIGNIYGCDWSTVKNRIHENPKLLEEQNDKKKEMQKMRNTYICKSNFTSLRHL